MKVSVDKLANAANGRSQACKKCVFHGLCDEKMFTICSNAFREGYKKGYTQAKKDFNNNK